VAGTVIKAAQATERIDTRSTVELAQVQHDPARFTGQPVRWGGTIIAVHNHPDNTEIKVLARPLDPAGAPRAGSEGQGRFIARVGSFIEPAEVDVARHPRPGTVAGGR
jgi:outer membrane lipoprotein